MDNRPLSPHLTVYKPQITSVLSIFHRITGAGLAVSTTLVVFWLASIAMGKSTFVGFNNFLNNPFIIIIFVPITIINSQDKVFKNPLAENLANAIQKFAEGSDYTHILSPSSTFGKNMSPKLSALMDVQQISDITKITVSYTHLTLPTNREV